MVSGKCSWCCAFGLWTKPGKENNNNVIILFLLIFGYKQWRKASNRIDNDDYFFWVFVLWRLNRFYSSKGKKLRLCNCFNFSRTSLMMLNSWSPHEFGIWFVVAVFSSPPFFLKHFRKFSFQKILIIFITFRKLIENFISYRKLSLIENYNLSKFF